MAEGTDDLPMSTPVVCLLPARNASGLLPDWFASVSHFADAVVALDDGSEDDTAAVLRAHPLVVSLLTNPRRRGYAGWDDAANRRRLLEAATALRPRWIMQLDADERMPSDDAVALRAFLLGDADPAFAYRFRVCRMVDDLDHYDVGHEQWVARCFAPGPNQRLPDDRLHFVAVPTAFGPARRIRTTFRIQHLAGLTDADRRRQHAKYREADPESAYQADYRHLLKPPADVRTWVPRSVALHALAGHPLPQLPGADPPRFVSAVVVAVGPPGTPTDGAALTDRLDALVRQDAPGPFQVVAVIARGDHAAATCAQGLGVEAVTVAPGTSAADAHEIGFAHCRGEVLVAPTGPVAPGYLAALLRGHAAGFALVCSAVRPAADAPAALARILLERPGDLVGAAGEPEGPDCSIVRDAWAELGAGRPATPLPSAVARMIARGYSATRRDDALVLVEPTGASGLAASAFARGRAQGRRALRPRVVARAWRQRPADLRGVGYRALPLVVVGLLVESVGIVAGWITRTAREIRRERARG